MNLLRSTMHRKRVTNRFWVEAVMGLGTGQIDFITALLNVYLNKDI